MGQREILEFLEKERKKGERWFTTKEIIKALNYNNGSRVYNCLLQLTLFNCIEWRGVGIWSHHKEFRGKKSVMRA